jgi:hypothetical protein
MQVGLSHDVASAASVHDDVAAQEQPQPVPPEVLLDMARSLLVGYHRLFTQKEARIAELERRLALASLAWRPAGTILQ